MIQAYEDYIYITVDARTDEVAKQKGHDGKRIVIDTSFDPFRHTRIWGNVVSVPKRLSRFMMIGQDHFGWPTYHKHSTEMPNFKYINDIVPEIKIGDKIYFNHRILSDERNLVGLQPVRGKMRPVWKVRYDAVYCAVRKKKIIMIGGHVLLEPDMESWEEIRIPTFNRDILDLDGKPTLRPKKEWLWAKQEPEARYLRAFVRHIGTPIKGWEAPAKAGDLVVMRRINSGKSTYPTKLIEDREYYVTRQRMIEGIITEAKDEQADK